jgi:hypothetical protein
VLQALKLVDEPQANMDVGRTPGLPLAVEWVTIDEPDHDDDTDAGPTATCNQAYAKGAAAFNREKSMWVGGRKVYFDVTTGGVAGQGQVWEYDPERELLTLLFESPGSTVLQSPDNVGIVAKTGHIFLQEDGSGEQFIRGLTRNGQIYDFAKTAANETEFAGGCFDPHGQILFVNQQETGAICPRVHRTRAPSRTRSGAPGRRWTDRPTGDSSSRELPTARRAGLPFRRAPSRPAGRVRSLGLPIAPWQPAVASPGLPSFSTTFTTVPHACGGVPDTRGMKPALLCELHAHTTWSDGCLALRELVDLYGRAGFDVLCITDHVLREDDPWWPPEACVHEANFGSYLAAVEAEADRARALYDLLVVPG